MNRICRFDVKREQAREREGSNKKLFDASEMKRRQISFFGLV